jgi:hypothetical protein
MMQWRGGSGRLQSALPEALHPAAATRLPAALPLFATGLAGLGLLGWRQLPLIRLWLKRQKGRFVGAFLLEPIHFNLRVP